MFQFPRSTFIQLFYSLYDTQALPWVSFLIRISVIQCLFAAPHSFSQLVTSFFGSWCQGIHHMLLLAWSNIWDIVFLSFSSNTVYYTVTSIFLSIVQFSRCISGIPLGSCLTTDLHGFSHEITQNVYLTLRCFLVSFSVFSGFVLT